MIVVYCSRGGHAKWSIGTTLPETTLAFVPCHRDQYEDVVGLSMRLLDIQSIEDDRKATMNSTDRVSVLDACPDGFRIINNLGWNPRRYISACEMEAKKQHGGWNRWAIVFSEATHHHYSRRGSQSTGDLNAVSEPLQISINTK